MHFITGIAFLASAIYGAVCFCRDCKRWFRGYISKPSTGATVTRREGE